MHRLISRSTRTLRDNYRTTVLPPDSKAGGKAAGRNCYMKLKLHPWLEVASQYMVVETATYLSHQVNSHLMVYCKSLCSEMT